MTDPREQFSWPNRPAWVASAEKIGGMILIAVEDFAGIGFVDIVALSDTFGTRAIDVEPEMETDPGDFGTGIETTWLQIRVHNITRMPGAES